jgi:creatinine amidohydrolase/Fe(II)-dependent formamide hydrolase-like protein
VRRAAAEERVALVPVATLEDHGPHLPVDTDLRIVTEICERAATEAAGRVLLLPAIPHGCDPHHMDFPGAVTIGWDTFTATAPTSAGRWPTTASGGCCSSTATAPPRAWSRRPPGW